MRCRYCKDRHVCYSHRRGFERWLAPLLLRPYRCEACTRRYLGLSERGRRLFLEGSTRRKWLYLAGAAAATALGGLAFAFVMFKVLDQVTRPARAPKR